LDAVILGIGHVKVAGGIEGDAPGVAEFARFGAGTADDFERVIGGVKDLDAAVAEFADILASGGIDADVVGIAQFAFG